MNSEHGARRALEWHVGGGAVLRFDCAPVLMGIVNVTPDSFSDGGLYLATDAAILHAQQCVDEGAAIVDVGGESTRPGAQRVPDGVQISRTLPVIQSLIRARFPALISIDTTRASVARAALNAGAAIANDVSAGTEDAGYFTAVAEHNAGIVLMHRAVPPGQDSYSDQYTQRPQYGDVVQEVLDHLLTRAAAAERAGVRRNAIALDPGLGFGKDVDQNYQLLDGIGAFAATGYPIVVGASRKSFIGAVTGAQLPADRDSGSVAAALAAVQRGATVLRVHNVLAHRAALEAQKHIKRVAPVDEGSGTRQMVWGTRSDSASAPPSAAAGECAGGHDQ